MDSPGRTTTGDLMMFAIFESKQRRVKDALEVRALFQKYGDGTFDILTTRMRDRGLADRDRRHWKRLLNKAKSYQPINENKLVTNPNTRAV